MNLYLKIYNTFLRNLSGELGNYLRKIIVQKIFTNSGKDINIGIGVRLTSNISLGEGSGIGRDCELQSGVVIGDNVMIGPNVYFLTTNHDFSDVNKLMVLQGFRDRLPIIVKDNVWIGARVIILPGVTIGTGSVIGAGTVVTKNVPNYCVYCGNPGKVIKYRK